jgi:hypothetical protein
MRQVYCDCAKKTIDANRCDMCDFGDDYYDSDIYEDPPLYPLGHLAGMTLEQLQREADRQSGIQGSLGDAEYIDDAAVERAETRYRLVEMEIRRRQEVAA